MTFSGLQHCKVYIFDDALIMSGANLSADYFEARQDRYVLVEDCPALADYYEQLIGTVALFSLRMDENINFSASPAFTSHPFEKDIQDFVAKSNEKMRSFMEDAQKAYCVNEEDLRHSGDDGDVDTEMDTWIFPSVQMGPLEVHQDSQLTEQILRSGQPGGPI